MAARPGEALVLRLAGLAQDAARLVLRRSSAQITKGEILTELQEKTAIPGVLPTLLQPIQTRLVMLQTGFRAMMGVKIYGSDLKEIERIGLQIEQLLKEVPGATDIVADRIVGKPYLEFEIDRDRIARYGVNIRDVQDVIEIAIGGMNIMESVEGRERYPIRVRYLREFREDIPELEKILVPTQHRRAGAARAGAHHQERARPAGDQGRARPARRLRHHEHARPRRSERGRGRRAPAASRAARTAGSSFPPATTGSGAGSSRTRCAPRSGCRSSSRSASLIMFVMLYLGFRRWWIAPIIFFDVLVSLSGGFHHAAALGREPLRRRVGRLPRAASAWSTTTAWSSPPTSKTSSTRAKFRVIAEIREAVVQAGLKRIRASLMTICTTVFGLLPDLLGHRPRLRRDAADGASRPSAAWP